MRDDRTWRAAMSNLLAIDPGSEQSALVFYNTFSRRPDWWKILPNDAALSAIDTAPADALAVEMVASYGMAVGASVFETCVWSGRFIERWFLHRMTEPHRVFRRDVKLHLCGSQRAKDSNIRQAVIDRYGSDRRAAIGVKASPGPLYGMKADCWQALGVAITAAETQLTIAREAAVNGYGTRTKALSFRRLRACPTCGDDHYGARATCPRCEIHTGDEESL